MPSLAVARRSGSTNAAERDPFVPRSGTALKRFIASLSLLALVSCSAQTDTLSIGLAQLSDLIAKQGVDPPAVIVPYRLSREMKEWAHELVPASVVEDSKRLRLLTTALLRKSTFGITYDRNHTATAEQVFETRTANCLAFTNLFVGMAREIGIPVFFVEVRDVKSYRKEGDLIVVSDHVAVGFGPSHDTRVFDFGFDPSSDHGSRRVVRISDYRAIAMYYSNRGAEYLRAEEYESAVQWLRTAVAIDPDYASSWVNLGVSLRRAGRIEAAEAAYRTALEIDIRSVSAFQNLAALRQSQGHVKEALDLLAMSNRANNRNPYTYVTLGDLSMRHGRVEEAGRFYHRAVRLRGGEADPLAAMGLWELLQGDERKARRLLKKAERAESSSDRVALLRRRLEADEG